MKCQLISIIIPVYKVNEKLLRKSIESCINQTYKNIEIIPVDDGSPDNCGKILDEYADKDKRVKVIHQKNKGLSSARNSGVKVANGEFMMFLDGDDWLESETCEYTLKKAIKTNVDIVCFNRVEDYLYGKSNVIHCPFKNNKIYSTSEELKYMQSMVITYNSYVSSANGKLVNMSLIKEKNIYHNEALKQGIEGIEYNFRLFSKASSILFIDNVFYHYICNPDSITHKHNEENDRLILKGLEIIKENIDKNDKNMLQILYTRALYALITITISSCFSPTNMDSYRVQKRYFNEIINCDISKASLKYGNIGSLDLKRKIIIFLIKNKLCKVLKILSKIRYNTKLR